MLIREAKTSDAEAMSDVLQELIAAGSRTKSGDLHFVVSHYLDHPHRLHCFVAVDDDGDVLGFQSLKRAHVGNPYGTPTGWGIIGTHVRPTASRTGVGRRLFSRTLESARKAELPAIEAYIAEENASALSYYEALGFKTWRTPDGIICKSLHLR